MSKTMIKAAIIFGLITLILVIIIIPSRGVRVSGFTLIIFSIDNFFEDNIGFSIID